MKNKLGASWALFFCFVLISAKLHAQPPCNGICGKWETAEKNLIVEVYKSGNDFKARIVWFKADSEKQMQESTDDNNPDKALKARKLLGINVLEGLIYKPESKSWEGGMIYDAHHGRYWNASAYINRDGVLKVKGYWHFKFIGRTMDFNRI